jgi:hypothetical protein
MVGNSANRYACQFQETNGRRYDTGMKPQGRRGTSGFVRENRSRITDARSTGWAECRDKKVLAPSRRGNLLTFLFIGPFYDSPHHHGCQQFVIPHLTKQRQRSIYALLAYRRGHSVM